MTDLPPDAGGAAPDFDAIRSPAPTAAPGQNPDPGNPAGDSPRDGARAGLARFRAVAARLTRRGQAGAARDAREPAAEPAVPEADPDSGQPAAAPPSESAALASDRDPGPAGRRHPANPLHPHRTVLRGLPEPRRLQAIRDAPPGTRAPGSAGAGQRPADPGYQARNWIRGWPGHRQPWELLPGEGPITGPAAPELPGVREWSRHPGQPGSRRGSDGMGRSSRMAQTGEPEPFHRIGAGQRHGGQVRRGLAVRPDHRPRHPHRRAVLAARDRGGRHRAGRPDDRP